MSLHPCRRVSAHRLLVNLTLGFWIVLGGVLCPTADRCLARIGPGTSARHAAADAHGDIASQLVDGVDRSCSAKSRNRSSAGPSSCIATSRRPRSTTFRSSPIGSGWPTSSACATRACVDGHELLATTSPAGAGRPRRRLRGVRRALAGLRRRARRRAAAGADRANAWRTWSRMPDADQTPEMIAGLVEGVPAESQFARRLAESGCRVLVPALVDREHRSSAAGRS